MEANICDINHLDADVLLPPRKRLLAGFKKESSYSNGGSDQPMVATPSPPSASSSNCSSTSDVNTHLSHLLSSHLNNASLSPEEVLEASRAAALAAAKAAVAARATANEKAEIAAKAVAAAKSALELVALFSQETTSKDRNLKKNKVKKHVPVHQLYKKNRPVVNHKKDEVFTNSSPGMSTSEWKGHKHKRPRSLSYEKTKASTSFSSNGYAVAGVIDSEDSTPDISEAKLGNGEAESSLTKANEVTHSPVKKRGRVKLKKLPLSLCSSRDQENGKEDSTSKTQNDDKPTPDSKPLFSSDPMEAPAPPTWKCQDFKAPACIKQNKVMQS